MGCDPAASSDIMQRKPHSRRIAHESYLDYPGRRRETDKAINEDKVGKEMILQSTVYQKQNIDLSSAPWTMHEFFAGSGLVAYGLRGMFAPVWANDISEQKAAVYEANFGCERFVLDDIKNIKGINLPFAHLSWASFPCQDLSLAGSIGGIHASRSGLVWEWLRVLDEMDDKPKILLLENVAGLLSTNGGDNYRGSSFGACGKRVSLRSCFAECVPLRSTVQTESIHYRRAGGLSHSRGIGG